MNATTSFSTPAQTPIVLPSPPSPADGGTKGSYTAGKFSMDIGKINAGWVQSVEGGHATADTVEEKNPNASHPSMSTAQFHNISAVDQQNLRQKFGTPSVIPEVGDEVLVVFEHGDIKNPTVIGNVWKADDSSGLNSKDSGDSKVPWQKHKNSEGDSPTLEFKSGEPKTMQVELMADTYEQKSTSSDSSSNSSKKNDDK